METRIKRRVLTVLLVLLLLGNVRSFAAETLFNQHVTWKYGKDGSPWKTSIEDSTGKQEYELMLRPLWDLEGGVLALEVVVARPDKPGTNILGERQNGAEYPFVITVEELTRGLSHSKFGKTRSAHVDDLTVNITVEHFRLGKGVGGGSIYCKNCRNLQELSLGISLNK